VSTLEPSVASVETAVAIVGRPNVGKSSLVNARRGEDRMVVEPQAGTTVDAIDSLWPTPAGLFVLVDTAGIRRQAHFADESEFYASMRALNALQRADLACVVVDATQVRAGEARIASRRSTAAAACSCSGTSSSAKRHGSASSPTAPTGFPIGDLPGIPL
jgi:GTP-binding protein